MPTTYAHYRFGKEILNILSHKNIIFSSKERQLFMIGLHGPDILFFYHPFRRNAIKTHGHKIHENPGSIFFARAANALKYSFHTKEDVKLATAYIYGFICHYALDSTCHPYIYGLTDVARLRHSEIESEFDRMLLEMDGHDPYKTALTGHINATPKNAYIISKFFPKVNTFKMLETLISFVGFNNMLVAPNNLKRKLVLASFKPTNYSYYLSGMLINIKPNPECDKTSAHLLKLYDKSIDLAVTLICDFDKNKDNLSYINATYKHTFSRN